MTRYEIHGTFRLGLSFIKLTIEYTLSNVQYLDYSQYGTIYLLRTLGERASEHSVWSRFIWLHWVKRRLSRKKDSPDMVIWNRRLVFFVPVSNKVVKTMLSPLVRCCYTENRFIHPTATCTVLYCMVHCR